MSVRDKVVLHHKKDGVFDIVSASYCVKAERAISQQEATASSIDIAKVVGDSLAREIEATVHSDVFGKNTLDVGVEELRVIRAALSMYYETEASTDVGRKVDGRPIKNQHADFVRSVIERVNTLIWIRTADGQ